MKIVQKFLLTITVTMLLCGLFVISAYAETEGIYSYSVTDGKAIITDVDTSVSGDVTIPSILGGYPVSRIGSWAFYGCKEITSVAIGNGVVNIEESAFRGCRRMTSVSVPDSVTNIGEKVFFGCKMLSNISIGNGVSDIEKSAFWDTKFYYNENNWENKVLYAGKCLIEAKSDITGDYVIKDGTLCVANAAFSDCKGLTGITIPESLISIGRDSFVGCYGLNEVHITNIIAWCNFNFYNETSNPLHYAHNLYLNDSLVTELVIPNVVTRIGDFLFPCCSGLTSVTISDSVTSIGKRAFWNCLDLTSVIIGNNVTSIGDEAFACCDDLTDVVIPDSVTSVGDKTFIGCERLISVMIGNGVTNIGEMVFYDCRGLTDIVLPRNLKRIGEWAFYGCVGLTSITIPDSVLDIGDCAFFNCVSLNDLIIPNNVESIGDSAFSGCRGLTSVTLPNREFSIGNWAFFNCGSLTKITIPSSVCSLGYGAFQWCSELECVVIQDGLLSISKDMFIHCEKLTRVEIPVSVTSISSGVFDNTNVTDIYYRGTESQWNDIAIEGNNDVLERVAVHYETAMPAMAYHITEFKLIDSNGGSLAIPPLNDRYTVRMTFSEVKPQSGKVYLLLAAFTKEGAMPHIDDMRIVEIPTGSNVSVDGTLLSYGKPIKKIKAFVWESLGGMAPLSETMEL